MHSWFKPLTRTICAAVLALSAGMAQTAKADEFKFRIASGHPGVNTYVNLLNTFFVPEVTKRVAERTKH
jgi:hypothetical protein